MDTLQQNTDAWLEWRKSKIGASDAPIIMGKSPWKTAAQLWKEKISDEIVTFESEAMRRGKALEPLAREELEKELRTKLAPDIRTHKEHHFMIASLDGISEDGQTLVEIKCPGTVSHQLAMRGEIAEHYKIQMQHQMAVTDLDTIFYYSFDGQTGVTIEYKRDQELIDAIIVKEQAFYECMVRKISPDAHKFKTDDEWFQFTNLWKDIQERKRKLADEEAKCRETLIELSGGEAIGNGIKVSQVERMGNIDYAKITVLKAIDLERYRKDSSKYWRITAEEIAATP